jgi:hypothetical protein
MTESEFLAYCQNQVKGPLKDEDMILMLTAWGQISYNLGYNQALKEHHIAANASPNPEKE